MNISKVVLVSLLCWGMVSMSVLASTSPEANTEAHPVTKSRITMIQKPKVKVGAKTKIKKNNKTSKQGKLPKKASARTQNKIQQSSGIKVNMSDQSPNTAAQKNPPATTQNSTTTQNKIQQSSGVKLHMVDP